MWVPLRAGSDILFLGALIHYVLENNRYFHEYVVNYTNAPTIIREEFKDTEELDGVFSGLRVNDKLEKEYDPSSWLYEGTETKGADQSATHHPDSGGHGLRGGPGGGHGHDRGGEVEKSSEHRLRPHLAASAVRVPDPEAAFRALHAGDGGAVLRRAQGIVPEGGGDIRLRLRPGQDGGDLLRRGLDAALQGGADHPHGGDPANAAGQHWTAGRRDSGAARARVDPGFDRYSHAVRHSAGLPADADVRIGREPALGLHPETQGEEGRVVELRRVLHQPDEGLLRRPRRRRTTTGASTGSRG